MTALSADLVALLLRQGRAWIERMACLEGWLDQREADELVSLQTCPEACLADHVEALRRRMWDAMEQAGDLPQYERTTNGQPIQSPAPPLRRARGVARHLKRTPIAKSAQAELFGS